MRLGIFPKYVIEDPEAISPYRRAWKKERLINSTEYAAGLVEIKKKITELDREKTNKWVPKYIVGKGHKTKTPNDTASDRTIQRYRLVWKGLLDFLILMKDWESAILLLPDGSPPNPLPVSHDMAILYIMYHTLPKGDMVPDHPTGSDLIIPGRNNQGLQAAGDWRGVSTLGIFRSALSKIHECFDPCRRQYINKCTGCRPREGCNLHPNETRFWRVGNVITNQDFKRYYSLQESEIKEKYESKKAVHFMPSELRKMRANLLTSNDPEKLMLWTVMIVGIKLFLRIEEVLTLQISASFSTKHCIIKGKEIRSICVVIKGKTDKTDKYFHLYDDPECPEFSPVRALLLYIAATGRKEGYLFPKLDQLLDETTTNPYGYEEALNDLRYLYHKVLNMKPKTVGMVILIIGTHSLRKTAFLLAYWGKKMEFKKLNRTVTGKLQIPTEDHAAILSDARHCTITSTCTYLSDAASLFDAMETAELDDPQQKVGPHKHIYITHLHSLEVILSTGDRLLNSKTVKELAEMFVYDEAILNFSNQKDILQNIPELCQKMMKLYVTPQSASTADLLKAISPHLEPELFHQWKNHVEGLLLATANHTHGTLTNNMIQDTGNDQASRLAPAVPPTKKRGRLAIGSIAKPSKKTRKNNNTYFRTSKNYHELYKLATNTSTKCEVLIDCTKELKGLWSRTCKPANKKYDDMGCRAAKIAACIKHCYNGDIPSFVNAKCFVYSNYKCPQGKKHKVSFVREGIDESI